MPGILLRWMDCSLNGSFPETVTCLLFSINLLEAQWVGECGNRCAAIDSGEMPLIAADLVMAKYRR